MTILQPAQPAPAVTDTAVEAQDLVKVYGEGPTAVTALDHVSVRFRRGEFTAIMGASGSGKSTLMHCLAGLDAVTSGTVLIDGKAITAMGDRELTRLRRKLVGFVFQAFNLLPTLTAEQNILLPAELSGARVDREWLRQVSDQLGIAGRLGHRPSELSGGQQQRVAIARALLTKPAVIFADEPTGNLDSTAGQEVLSLLRDSARRLHQTIIMVTHDPAAAAYADRVLLFADGRIAGDLAHPTPEHLLTALGALGA